MSKWTPDSIGDLDGKTIVITGGNSGIGYETAKVLACHGGDIVIACRNLQRAQRAIESINILQPGARITAVQLDLADLASVRRCVAELNHRYDHLDVLINNAGVMALPYTKTVDGFEMQLGTNHFGHFALTAQLYPLLKEAAQPRIVTVASNAHKTGRIQFDDINSEERYSEWERIHKVSWLTFFFHELTRRTTREAPALRSLACHPGYADTKLLNLGPAVPRVADERHSSLRRTLCCPNRRSWSLANALCSDCFPACIRKLHWTERPL